MQDTHVFDFVFHFIDFFFFPSYFIFQFYHQSWYAMYLIFVHFKFWFFFKKSQRNLLQVVLVEHKVKDKKWNR